MLFRQAATGELGMALLRWNCSYKVVLPKALAFFQRCLAIADNRARTAGLLFILLLLVEVPVFSLARALVAVLIVLREPVWGADDTESLPRI